MRKEAVRAVALAALLLGVAVAWAQQPAPPAAADKDKPKEAPAKSKLEEMLEKALHDNPDVRLAAAKVAEAEAELSRARLLVVQKVASAYQAVEAQKAAVESAAAELAEVKTIVATGAEPPGGQRAAEQKLIDAKAKLAQLEAELPYLLGQQPPGVQADLGFFYAPAGAFVVRRGADAATIRRMYLDLYGRLPTKDELAAAADGKAAVQGPTADRIRAALDKPFTYDGKTARLDDVILALKNAFEKDNPGLLMNVNGLAQVDADNDNALPTSRFDHVPYGAMLEWVEDSIPDCRVVVRDYGVVLAPKDQLPPGAPLLRDFWKGAKAEDKDATKPEAKDQPAKTVEGQVKDVDKDGRIRIDIGKNAGLAKGDVLTVLRIRQETEVPLYLAVGRIRVVEVGDCDAVAEPAEKANLAIQPGDKVRGAKTPDKQGTQPDAKDQPPNPPAKLVKGEVKEVDKDNRIHINIGKNDGLAKGDSLQVVRQENPNGRTLLLGTLRVVQVGDGEAVAEPLGDIKQPIQPGDHVVRIDISPTTNK